MKKLLLMFGALLAAMAPALADEVAVDKLVSGTELAQAPLPPPPVIDWNGFYLGGLIGGRWGNSDWKTTCPGLGLLGGSCSGFPAVDTAPAASAVLLLSTFTNPAHFDLSAAEGGGLIGWNFQSGRWVFGPEGDFAWGNASRTLPGIPGQAIPPMLLPADFGTNTSNVRQSWDASARLRAGWLFTPNLLGFVTGGFAVTDARASFTCGVLFPVGLCGAGPYFGRTSSYSSTLTGFTVGAGAEYAVSSNWLIRLQYRYSDYGSISFNNVVTPLLLVTTNAINGIGVQETNSTKVSLQTHEVQAALVYKFGP